MTRTDIHRPSAPEFDPEAYDFAGCWDLRPEWPGEGAARVQAVYGFCQEGYRFAQTNGSDHCGHCGTAIRYAALLLHPATKTMIFVGETCLENRFLDLTKADFQRLRETARLNRERATKIERQEALVAEHPALAWAFYPEALEDSFLADVAWKIRKYGDPSERQIEAFERGLVKMTERAEAQARREAEAAALRASGVQVPTGRVQVEGTVASVKGQDTAYGYVEKMLVVTDAGWKVWGTVPAALDGVEKGARVRFTATVEPSTDDALFGFYKRPTKAETLEEAKAA